MGLGLQGTSTAGQSILRGSYDASVNAYPSTGGTGVGGVPMLGNYWYVSVAGTLPTGKVVEVGDTVTAVVNSATNTQADWVIGQNNIAYVPENVANKSDSYTSSSSTTYASTKALVDGLATKALTTLVGSPCEIQVACSDETTALTTGTKVTFRMPFPMTVTSVRGSVTTAATGATLLAFDVKESGTTIFSTKPTFDASELTTTTAATPSVINDSALADDAQMTIIIDAIGNTIAGAGLKVTLIGTRA